jgi:hypothetical protein
VRLFHVCASSLMIHGWRVAFRMLARMLAALEIASCSRGNVLLGLIFHFDAGLD